MNDENDDETRVKTPAEKEAERRGQLALSALHAQCEANGAACIRFEDGQMFMFSRKTIETLREKMDADNQDRSIIFVKTGPILREN